MNQDFELIIEHFKFNNHCPNCQQKFTSQAYDDYGESYMFTCGPCNCSIQAFTSDDSKLIQISLCVKYLLFTFYCYCCNIPKYQNICYIEHCAKLFDHKNLDTIIFNSSDDLLNYFFNIDNKLIKKYNKLIPLL